jgi:peptide/nickel transport system substrate-binding protein
MIKAMLSARDKATYDDAVHALDRLLLEGHYALQLFHAPSQWVARWNQVQHPARTSLYGFRPETGWIARP